MKDRQKEYIYNSRNYHKVLKKSKRSKKKKKRRDWPIKVYRTESRVTKKQDELTRTTVVTEKLIK